MIVNSENTEFGYELISVLPYAYWLHDNGKLEKTISGNDTECLYYFSPNHEINPAKRSWYNTEKLKTPNRFIHVPELDKSKFLPPPLKEHYKNDRFKFKKELVIICNRYNTEWNTKPINFFSKEALHNLFTLLKDYQVVYININGRPELYDNAPPEGLGEFEMLKKYKNVINIHELHENNKDLTFNTLQLMLFANCSKFVTMNGGHAILASYFGGENIIMSKPGRPQAKEINENVNSFYGWYADFGGQRCMHVPNEERLLTKIKSLWVDKDPLINILIRTSGRPNYFDVCIKSILNQGYENLNIFVSVDNDNDTYPVKYPIYRKRVYQRTPFAEIENSKEYGKPFPHNLYLNDLHQHVKDGFIMYLDDDDKLNKGALKEIAKYPDADMIFWRVKIDSRYYPDDEHWMKPPALFQISGIGFAFHSKHIKYAKWDAYKRGDYRVSKNIFEHTTKHTYINRVFAECQEGAHWGQRIDKIKNQIKNDMEKIVKIKIIKDVFEGHKLSDKPGTILEVNEARAKQFVRMGVAEFYKGEVIIQPMDDVVAKSAYDKLSKENKKLKSEVQELLKVIEELKKNKQEMAMKEYDNVIKANRTSNKKAGRPKKVK